MLGEFSTVTADVLLYLDAFDKAGRRSQSGSSGWDHAAFAIFLKRLAKTFRGQSLQDAPLERQAIGDILRDLTEPWIPALRDLESEGVLSEEHGAYQVAPDQLSLGMGLWLSGEARAARKQGRDIREVLRDCLEPNAESDERVAWARAAVMPIFDSCPPDYRQFSDVSH
jgi:hypothetical protein